MKPSDQLAEFVRAAMARGGTPDAIRDALKGYLPELERGLAESAAALQDAENAQASGSRAGSMPDPSQNREQPTSRILTP